MTSSTPLYVYRLDLPVDTWHGWMSEMQYLHQLINEAHQSDGLADVKYIPTLLAAYESLRARAFALAEQLGWHGDIREGPYVSALPLDKPAFASTAPCRIFCWASPSRAS